MTLIVQSSSKEKNAKLADTFFHFLKKRIHRPTFFRAFWCCHLFYYGCVLGSSFHRLFISFPVLEMGGKSAEKLDMAQIYAIALPAWSPIFGTWVRYAINYQYFCPRQHFVNARRHQVVLKDMLQSWHMRLFFRFLLSVFLQDSPTAIIHLRALKSSVFENE